MGEFTARIGLKPQLDRSSRLIVTGTPEENSSVALRRVCYLPGGLVEAFYFAGIGAYNFCKKNGGNRNCEILGISRVTRVAFEILTAG